MARKRNDIDDAPIDGDYTKDVVLNKREGMSYAYVSIEDLPVMRGRGYQTVERSEDGPCSPFDVGSGDGQIEVGGQLRLMEIPTSRYEAIQRRSENDFNRQMVGHQEGLQQTTATRYGSLGPDNRPTAGGVSFNTNFSTNG